jgi:hypothetical protein
VVRLLLVVALSFASAQAAADGGSPQPARDLAAENQLRRLAAGGAPTTPAPLVLIAPAARPQRSAGRFARAAAITGLVSAGLLLGGAITIATVDDPESERITRGLHLGFTAVAAPFVAFGAYSARRGSALFAGRRVRAVGWIAYAGAIASGVAQWYGAFHGDQAPAALTITGGAMGALSVLPQAWDAYLSGRHARARSLRLGLSARGLALHF